MKILSNWQIIAIATIVFIVVILFVDKNKLENKRQLKNQRQELYNEIDSLKAQIEQDSITIERLKHDDKYLEKFAREKFYMLKDGEEIFIRE